MRDLKYSSQENGLMNSKKSQSRWYGLMRGWGWKKNLLAAGGGALVFAFADQISNVMSNVRGLSEFSLSIAALPLVGFLWGIWGCIGCLLAYVSSLFIYTFGLAISDPVLVIQIYGISLMIVFIYSALPALLWYMFPLKGETQARPPRMDTSGHVIKYYLVMAGSVLVLTIVLSLRSFLSSGPEELFLDMGILFLGYLDMSLIIGMPVMIILALVRNRSLTINERMVLAFLIVAVTASVLVGYIFFQNTVQLKPEIFENYEKAMDELMKTGNIQSEDIDQYVDYWNRSYLAIGLMLNGLLVIEMIFMKSIEKKVTLPILRVKDVLGEYTQGEEGSLAPETVKTQCGQYLDGYGEVSALTKACVDMVGDIDIYTRNLQAVTAEKERIGAELNVAAKIQQDMLPGIFPPFPDRKEMDLFASMKPAKEVGGDFYDFYFIDHDHLALTVADVSGKGVPAALFMVISKTLLKNQAQTGASPQEILENVNRQLCQNNESLMFCTAWLGILNLKEGTLAAANAGHEYPVIGRKGGRFELYKDRHGMPLGAMETTKYHGYELQLAPGDILFEYSDGVTEATGPSEELFGEERMLEALNVAPDKSPDRLIGAVGDAIGRFVNGEPQFDDITMLCIEYKGPGEF